MSCPRFSARRVLLAGAAALVAGCAKPEFKNLKQPTFPVRGEVRLDGKPLAGATIVLKPVDASKFKWREQPQATSDAEGKFVVFTYTAGDGAPSGDYRVGIAVLGASEDEGSDQVRRDLAAARLPAKYGDAATSGITAKVDPKATELPVFELSSR